MSEKLIGFTEPRLGITECNWHGHFTESCAGVLVPAQSLVLSIGIWDSRSTFDLIVMHADGRLIAIPFFGLQEAEDAVRLFEPHT